MSDIFSWAWERRRKDGIPPDESRFSMADVRNIFDHFTGEIISEKRIRQCEEDGIVVPSRTAGGHRKFSVTDVCMDV